MSPSAKKFIVFAFACVIAFQVQATTGVVPLGHYWILHVNGGWVGVQEFNHATYLYYGPPSAPLRIPLPLYVVAGFPVVGLVIVGGLSIRKRVS